ncbi:Oidioi.mRNA.OKI2018_I69.chr2.g4139.t1.cds [Oikopleura dioica]|uniref:Oidioi.mRNA.OKI2018_I69.chr2.g4139.t1.cds n=1 Tax=Oikopleura dioica TaxID=34765 RepID=A0ABN7SWV0_OIKDI|nr:Oidioi.mRNA.OKI2018_I69.chr2.g4139.t1.cds [Oikopleura dioica]
MAYRADGAVNLHYEFANTGVRILGGRFEIRKLKREIRLFGENAHTFLDIIFEKVPDNVFGPDPNGEDQQQKFVFPFSDEKSLTFFRAQYFASNGAELANIDTQLKKKSEARDEYKKAFAQENYGVIATRDELCRGDEYTIEMGHKPNDTMYINVHLKYSEPMKSKWIYGKEHSFTLHVPRHRKSRFLPTEKDDPLINISLDGPNQRSNWHDEIEIIECRGDFSNSGGPESAIVKIEVDNRHWEVDRLNGPAYHVDGRKWLVYEIDPGNHLVTRIINGVEHHDMPRLLTLDERINDEKNDLEISFFVNPYSDPVMTIESTGSRPEAFNEDEAILSIDLSEENIRKQLSQLAEPMEIHGNCDIEYDSNNGFESNPEKPAMEYIFLVDCSGSMSGSYMDATKKTLGLMFKSMDNKSKIIICRFGTRYEFQPRQRGGTNEPLDPRYHYNYDRNDRQRRPVPEMRRPEWITIDEDNDDQEELLQNYLERDMRANMGGTNIREPLQDIFKLEMSPDTYRNIFVMTDGAITNTREVIQMVNETTIQHEGRLRFFSLGIGSGASKSLCEGIAKNGRGSATYVLGDERIQTRTMEILNNASRPSVFLNNIILPDGLQRVGFSPAENNLNMPIFGSKRIFLKLKSTHHQILSVSALLLDPRNQLRFMINGQTIRLNYNIAPFRNQNISLKSFWAKQEIDFLEDERPRNIDVQEAQIDASIFGGVLCDYTAFVGVRDGVSMGPVTQVQGLQGLHSGRNTISNTPTYMAAGGRRPTGGSAFAGAGGLAFPPPPAAGGMMPAGIRNGRSPMSMGGPPAAGGIGGARRKSSRTMKSATISSTDAEKKKNDSARLDQLMSYTRTSGLWNAKKGVEIIRCLELFNKNFGKIFEHLRFKIQNDQLVLTILALAALEKYEADKQVEWYHISKKAKTKLSSHGINADEEIKSIIGDLS